MPIGPQSRSCAPCRALPAPRYCRQKEKGRADRAYVRIDGKRILLGSYGTPESYQRYAALIAGESKATPNSAAPEPAPAAPTLNVLMAAFLKHAVDRYGAASGEVWDFKGVFRVLRETHGAVLAKDFGPKRFKESRLAVVNRGWSRRYVNEQCGRIKRSVAWGVEEEILPPSAKHALEAVRGLARGEHGVKESEPVEPVPDDVVNATLPKLGDVVANMVRLQRLTGMRPAEVCLLRPCDLDRSGDVWLYKPPRHKTLHRGKGRTVAIGPKAQGILLRYLARGHADYCFRPCDTELKRLAALHAERKTPLSCGNRPGSNRKASPERSAGEKYTTDSFRRASQRACDRAFPAPEGVEGRQLAAWRAEHRWSPNQLRHTAATDVRKQFGLEAAQVMLGHSHADVTQVYAEKNDALAVEIAAKIG